MISARLRAFLVGLAALYAVPASPLWGQADEVWPQDGPIALELDLDGDGKPDRAVVTENIDDGRSDLNLYLSTANRTSDPASQPSAVKAGITQDAIVTLERQNATLVVVSSYSLYGSQWDERLSIAFLKGDFWITAIERSWEWNIRRPDLQVDVNIGSCNIDLVAGSGTASRDLEDPTALDMRYRPVRLADWSDATRPQPCNF